MRMERMGEGVIGILEMVERALLGVFGGRGVRGVFGLILILAMEGESSSTELMVVLKRGKELNWNRPEPDLSGGMIPAVAPPFAMTRWTPQTRQNCTYTSHLEVETEWLIY